MVLILRRGYLDYGAAGPNMYLDLVRRKVHANLLFFYITLVIYIYSSLKRKRTPLGRYSRPMHRVLGGS